MQGLYYELGGPRNLGLRRQELSAPLGPDEIEAVTKYSLISPGTELAAWSGKPPLRPGPQYPRLMGYSNVAEVVAVGRLVDNVREGAYIFTHQSHRSGFRCNRAEVLLREYYLDDCALRRMATTYLYVLGQRALLDAGFLPGKRVAIVGLGALGFTTASVCWLSASRPTIFTNGEIPQSLRGADIRPKMPSPCGAEIVINTSDDWADYQLCLQIAAPKATIALLGFPGRGKERPDFNPLGDLYRKGLTIKQIAPHEPDKFLASRLFYAYLNPGLFDTSPLISKRASWKDLASVYSELETNRKSLSVLLEW